MLKSSIICCGKRRNPSDTFLIKSRKWSVIFSAVFSQTKNATDICPAPADSHQANVIKIRTLSVPAYTGSLMLRIMEAVTVIFMFRRIGTTTK